MDQSASSQTQHEWHALGVKEVLSHLDVTEEGLTSAEATARLETYGSNTLPAGKRATVFIIFLRQFASPLVIVLLIAGVVSFIIGDRVDAGFIAFIVLFNALIGTYQEHGAERSAAELQKLLTINATVVRDGREMDIQAENVVPGDIVLLESGLRVPADVRLFSVNNLHIDESLLTGESAPETKQTDVVASDAVVPDRLNMAFAGAVVTTGRARGVVVATATHTQIGLIAKSVATTDATEPPLVIRIKHFARQITFAVLCIGVLIAGMQIADGEPLATVFFVFVALIISAIPEGLPIALTVALSVASRRMSKRNVIVRHLSAVESLGSCTLIASDKTGTLTVNQQTVKTIVLPTGETFAVSGQGYNDEGAVTQSGDAQVELHDGSRVGLDALIHAGVYANEATLTKIEDGGAPMWEHRGDAMDVAILALGQKYALSRATLLERVVQSVVIPYESEKKYSALYYHVDGVDHVAMKGAVEVIVTQCTTQSDGKGGTQPLNKEHIEQQALELSQQGYRVLAVAGGTALAMPQEEAPSVTETNLTLYGLLAFIDPVRKEVPDAIQRCRDAGVKVIMITGDHPATALAISQQLGLAQEGSVVITGADLDGIPPERRDEFDRVVSDVHVFARVAPLQKLRIVESLMRQGHFVAVTGDGVNDAPALKTANIGVAMGSGTDIAKDTSAMIAVDDNFASIVAGIEEGRYAYDNIRKVIYLLVSTGFAELALFFLATIFGTSIPLVAIQLLWLNVVTNGIQDIGLAFEGGEDGEDGVMHRKPRSPKEGIFNRNMIEQTALSGMVMSLIAFGTWYATLSMGWSEDAARNMTLLTMVFLQNVHVMNARSERKSVFSVPLYKNPILIIGVITAQAVHIAAMYIPFTEKLLHVQPITPMQWLTALGLALILLVTMELYKVIKRVRA